MSDITSLPYEILAMIFKLSGNSNQLRLVCKAFRDISDIIPANKTYNIDQNTEYIPNCTEYEITGKPNNIDDEIIKTRFMGKIVRIFGHVYDVLKMCEYVRDLSICSIYNLTVLPELPRNIEVLKLRNLIRLYCIDSIQQLKFLNTLVIDNCDITEFNYKVENLHVRYCYRLVKISGSFLNIRLDSNYNLEEVVLENGPNSFIISGCHKPIIDMFQSPRNINDIVGMIVNKSLYACGSSCIISKN